MSKAIFSPDVIAPRFRRAAEMIAERFSVSFEQIVSTMSEHVLIYYGTFDAAKNAVDFNLIPSSTGKQDEIRLDSQDGFVISSWGRGVRRCKKSEDGTELISNEPIMFSNQPQYFDGKVGAVDEYKSLLPYFMGKLKFEEKNGDPIITDYSGLNTYQEPLGSYSPATATLNEEYPEFSLDKVLRQVYPQQLLLGNTNYKTVIAFSNGVYSQIEGKNDKTGAARSTINVPVLVLRGWKVPGLANTKLIADKG